MTDASSRSVLVVEDDPSFGLLLRDVLEAAGHTVRLTPTSAGAMAAVEADLPDVLCVDIDLPDGTGWGLLDELERRGLEPATVIVATAGDLLAAEAVPGRFAIATGKRRRVARDLTEERRKLWTISWWRSCSWPLRWRSGAYSRPVGGRDANRRMVVVDRESPHRDLSRVRSLET